MLEIGIWQDFYVFKVPSCILCRKHPQMLDSFPWFTLNKGDLGVIWLGHSSNAFAVFWYKSDNIYVCSYTFTTTFNIVCLCTYICLNVYCVSIDVLELPNIACWLCYFCSIQLQVICHHWTYTSMPMSHKMRGNREELDGHLSTLSHHRSSAGFV